MIGPILLAVSWLLLRLEGRSLRDLGFSMPRRRGMELAIGFGIAGSAVVIQQLGLAAVNGVAWIKNPTANSALLLNGLRFTVNSVLFEEFVFRGYLLVQAIRWLGQRRAILLSSAAFGVYHWFTFGFGNPVQMAFVFLFTGAFGFMLASTFVATRSMAGPVGLHLGWNLITYVVFSAGHSGRRC